jgi:hypothetical protein
LTSVEGTTPDRDDRGYADDLKRRRRHDHLTSHAVAGSGYGSGMDLVALEGFIVAAKSRTYVMAGNQAEASRLGSHDLTFADGDWLYRDSYFGGSDFLGQEVVWLKNEPVWAMNYYGWIGMDHAITAAEAGRVIMSALAVLYREGRFLGGHSALVDGWEYHDGNTGDVAHFEGRERIADAGGVEVYALLYHGGLVRPD